MSTKDTSLDVRHGQQPALYASQFLINAGPEELILDCCSSVESTPAATVVPVHTRLALSWGAAERLHGLLQQAMAERSNGSVPAPHFRTEGAKLPSFGDTNV